MDHIGLRRKNVISLIKDYLLIRSQVLSQKNEWKLQTENMLVFYENAERKKSEVDMRFHELIKDFKKDKEKGIFLYFKIFFFSCYGLLK